MGLDASEIRRRWDRVQRATRAQVDEYRLNKCFVENEQWVAKGHNNEITEVRKKDPDRVRLTRNKFGPAQRSVLGQVFSRPLFFDVRPTAADDQTVAAANLSIQLLDYYRDTQEWDSLRKDLGAVTWMGGFGGLCLDWDPNAGREINDPDGGRKPRRVFGGKKQTLHEGDVCATVLAPGEFGVEPGARVAEKARWWIKNMGLPPEQAKDDFGLKEVPKADTTSSVTPGERSGAGAPEPLTTVLTYYERPHQDSKGEVTIVVGNDVVYTGEWPFPFDDRLNLLVSLDTPIHAKWWGKTILSSARSPQVALNQSESSIVEHMKLAGNARLTLSWTDHQRADEWTDTPGEAVGFEPQDGYSGPRYLTPPVMPNWWTQQPERLSSVIDEMLGATDVSRGVAPRNVESGLGISILSENAKSPLGGMADESVRVWSRWGELVLRTLEVKVTETRKGAYVNDPGDLPEEFEYVGGDLKGQTKAFVPLEAVAPRSKAQAEAWAVQLLQTKSINLAQFARLVDVPDQRKTLSIMDPHAQKQHRENLRMARGESIDDVLPDDFDDHRAHLEELTRFRVSEAYERLSSEAKQTFGLHAEIHDYLAALDAAKDQIRQSAGPNLGGAPNAQGTPGSMPPPEGAPPDEAGPDDRDRPRGGEPLGVGSGGLGDGLEADGQLPPLGLHR